MSKPRDLPLPHPPRGSQWSSASEELYSFVLRVRLAAPQRGGGPVRLQFHLEDVSAAQSWRLTDLNSVVEHLRERISAIEAMASA